MFRVGESTEEADQKFTSHMDNVSVSEEVYGRVGQSLRRLRNALFAFAGIYAAHDVFGRAIEEGRELEELWTNLSNRFGNEQFARDVTNWIIETENRLPIAREELQSFVETMDDFAIPPQMANLEGVLNAALGPAGDLNSAMSDVVSLAQSGDIQPFVESFAGRISPQQISESLQGAVTVQERIIALTDLLDQEFEGNIERQQKTVSGQLNLLQGIFNLFKQAFVGDPEAEGTFFGEWRKFIQGFTNWFLEREEEIIAFGRGMGQFFGQIFGLFRRSFMALGNFSDRMFNVLRNFITSSRELVNPFVLFLAIMINRVETFFDGFRAGFMDFFEVFGSVISGILTGLQELIEYVFGVDFESELGIMSDIIQTVFDPDVVEDFGRVIGFVTGGIVTFLATKFALIKMAGIIKSIGSAFMFVAGVFSGHPVIATILALAAAGVTLWRMWEDNLFGMRKHLEPIVNWMVDSFESIKETVVGLWNSISSEVGGFAQSISGELRTIWSVVQPIGEFLGSTLVEALKASGRVVWNIIKNTWILALDLLAGTASGVWEMFKGGITTIVNLLTGDLPGAWEGFKQMVGGLGSVVENVLTSVGSFFRNMFDGVIDNIGKSFEGLRTIWEDVFNGMFNWMGRKLNRFVLGPLDSLGGILGFEVPKIDVEGSDPSGGGDGSPVDFTPQLPNIGAIPMPADATAQNIQSERNFNLTVNAQAGENPETTARRIYRELERQERRKEERK